MFQNKTTDELAYPISKLTYFKKKTTDGQQFALFINSDRSLPRPGLLTSVLKPLRLSISFSPKS